MSSLAAGSNQGLGAVKQTPPPINIVVTNPPANTWPFKAITGQRVYMTYTHRVAVNLDSATSRRFMVNGFQGTTLPGPSAYQPFSFTYGQGGFNVFYPLLPYGGPWANINLRYQYGNSGSVATRLGNPSAYLTLTSGSGGAISFTSAMSGSYVELSMTAPGGVLDGCLIYRVNNTSGVTSLIFDYAIYGYIPSSWTDTGVSPGNDYSYFVLYHYFGSPPDTWTDLASTQIQTPDAPVVYAIDFLYGSDVYFYFTSSTSPSSGFSCSMSQYVDLGAGYEFVGGSSTYVDGWNRSGVMTLTFPYYTGGPAEGFVIIYVTNNNTGAQSPPGIAYNYFYT